MTMQDIAERIADMDLKTCGRCASLIDHVRNGVGRAMIGGGVDPPISLDSSMR